MSINNLYPDIAPSLLLDFANVKKLDPRVTFTRATTATYYDGQSVTKAEENLFPYSQEFDNGWWRNARAIITANDLTAPDGTTTAEKIRQASGTTIASVVFTNAVISSIAGLNYTYSIFAKAGTNRNFITFEDTFGGPVRNTWFNLSTGAVGTSNASHTASMINVGNGWYRCVVTSPEVTTSSTRQVAFRITETDNSLAVTDDQGFIHLWGAQLEQRDTVTAYQPTTTQAITNYIPTLLSAPANTARFDHDPVTSESLGLLVEEQRTNLLLRSEEFDNSYWNKQTVTITPNTIVAPDGTLAADKIIGSSGVAYWWLATQTYTFLPAGIHTLSVYFKAGEITTARIDLVGTANGNGGRADFNLLDGSLIGQGFDVLSTSSINVGNGWFRCSVTANIVTSGGAQAARYVSGVNNGSNGFFMWGAQVEAGAFPTSYIPTVASQVTRSADSASMTGANFSDWYRQDEGSLFVEAKPISLTGQGHNASGISDGSSSNAFYASQFTNGNIFYYNRSGAVDQINLSAGFVPQSGVSYKSSFGYKVNDFAASFGGGTIKTDTLGILPNGVNRLTIGNLFIGASQPLTGTIKKIAYYPQRLSNANLQALTS